MSILNSHDSFIGQLDTGSLPVASSADAPISADTLDLDERDRSQDSAPARIHTPAGARDAAALDAFRAAHPPMPRPVSGIVRASKLAREVLAAFDAGRSPELGPDSGRDTLSSRAIRAGWGRR